MVLDVQTLLVVNAANLVVMAATLPLIMGRQLSQAAASARNALLLQAMGLIAIVVSGFWPGQWVDHVISALAVFFLAVGQWLLFLALQGWLGPRHGGLFFKGLLVLAPVGYLLLCYSFPLRTAWANLMLVLQLLLVSQATLWPSTRLGGRWRWVVLGCSLVIAGFTVARTVLVLFYRDLYPSFLAPHPVNVVNMLAANVSLVLVTLAMLVAWREEAEAQLRDQAYTDRLTHLANRHGWDDRAQILVDQACRHGTPLALIMLDLDHFKQINDTLGHEAGDRVLQQVGQVLRANCRTSDIAARLGGEEFALLLPQTDRAAALLFEHRLRAALLSAGRADAKLAVNYSAGLAMLRASDETIAALMQRADAALYGAKDQGRGRCELARTEA